MIPFPFQAGGFGLARIPSAGGGGGSLYDEIIADNPWAYYQLGEAAAPSEFADSSGNGYDLTNIVATVTAGGTGLVSPGTSTDFDGTSGYISSTNNEFGTDTNTAFSGDKPVTIVMVVNLDAFSDKVLFSIGNISVAGSRGIFVQSLASGAVRFQMYTSSFKFVDTSASALATTTTAIIHCRRTIGGTGSIWVNGVNLTSGSTDLSGSIEAAASSSSGGNRIMLGALSASAVSNFTNGRLQHVAIFDSALSDARIAAQVTASGL